MILFMVVFSIFTWGANNKIVDANTDNEARPFEKLYTDIGDKTVAEAVKDFESHFDQDRKNCTY